MRSTLMIAAILCGATIAAGAASSHEPAKPARDMQASSCPVRMGTQLAGVDVYDGSFADQAILRPEDGDEHRGSWPLAYVYKAGRTVNLRCRYRDGTTADRELPRPVRACRYAIAKSAPFRVWCR